MSPSQASRDPGTAQRPSVLVVDDDEMVLYVLYQTLRRAQYDVRKATSAAEALELARSSPPDLLLTDLMMPEMNGVELAVAARDIRPELVLVFITGVSDHPALRSAAELSATVLQKPVTGGDILEAVKSAWFGQ